MESRKTVLTILLAGHQRRHKHKEQNLDTVREEEGAMTRKNSIETYTLPYVQVIASRNLIYDAGNPQLVLCYNLWSGVESYEEGEFKKEGTYVYLWLIHVDVWQKSPQYY